jgi:hypothetical protein
MRSQQTAGGSENSAFAVALDTSSLEYEVQMVFVNTLHQSFVKELFVNLIVQISGEFLTPSVELEVEEDEV